MRLARRKSDKLPCAIGVKIINFLSHYLFLTRMRESLTNAFRGTDRKKGENKGKVLKRVPFRMEIGRSSGSCGTRAGDDGGVEDESARSPIRGRT